jgi:inorganic pyrophosphatase
VDFFGALDVLAATHPIVIDRPRGSSHPRHPEVVYPLDYGYLDATVTADGHGVDLFRGTAWGGGLSGVYLSVDLAKADLEAKLLIDCTPTEVTRVGEFLSDVLGLAVHLTLRG